MRIMTEKDLLRLDGINKEDLPEPTEEEKSRVVTSLPVRTLPESVVPQFREIVEGPTEASPELLMKLGAIAPTPRVSSSEDVVLDGTGVQGAINTAANVATSSVNQQVVPGTMIQTSQGPMFQPNPTTVTVVPPARTIQIMPGEGESLQADEELGAPGPTALQATAQQTIPQMLPLQQQQQYPYPYPPPGYGPPGYGTQPYYMQGPPMAQPINMGAPINMGQAPAIYATQQLPGAQIFSSGVPGAPPTISVPTDQSTMSQFSLPSGPKPKKSITMRRRPNQGQGQGQGQGQEGGYQDEPSSSNSASVVVTVSKMG
jgi:hypothetical protein